jgi:hypothetical protein
MHTTWTSLHDIERAATIEVAATLHEVFAIALPATRAYKWRMAPTSSLVKPTGGEQETVPAEEQERCGYAEAHVVTFVTLGVGSCTLIATPLHDTPEGITAGRSVARYTVTITEAEK